MERFRYTPLRSIDEIRLFRLQPRTKSGRNAPLEATVQHVNLSASPLYTAVSWMWGPQEDLFDLLIDGRVLPVQANLRRIIQDLQDDHQARNLWIDAICIDQNSIQERNHQVGLMGKIYGSANYVVAALTTEQPKDRRKLAKTAKAVHKAFDRCLKERSTASISAASRLSSEYRLFFENSYWLRRWIIQEIIQARSVTLCCEGYQMPMSIMEGMSADSRPRDRSRKPSVSLKDMMNSGAMRLCRLRQEMDGDSLPLEELLYTHEAAKCSDFRDQVYALLSLSQHAKDHLPVRYDINEIELMVAVVTMSWLYEDLSPLRTLSFTCFLRQHLKIKDEQVRNVLLYRPRANPESSIGIQGVVRGIVRRHRVSVDTEDAALKFRNQVPALSANEPIALRFHQPVHHDRNAIAPLVVVDPLDPWVAVPDAPIAVPGLDQWLFAFDGEDSRRSSKAYRARATIAGLASTRIDIGDEIWQFERTPLAFVARPSEWGYTLVGRAYLLDKLSTGCHFDDTDVRPSHWQLEDDLVWVKDARLHEVLTPVIDVAVRGLLKLMSWAIYDTNS